MLRRSTLTLLMTLLVASAAQADDDGWVSIFNGNDLNGWRGNADFWSVKEGAITAQTTPDNLLKSNTFLVWSDGQPGDFMLRLKYKIVGGNSGVQYRSRVIDEPQFVVSGYQADIDSAPKFTGMNYEEKGRTFLAQRGESTTIAEDGTKETFAFADPEYLQDLVVKPEDWNEYLIVARGNHLQHFVNGVLTSEVIDNEQGKAAASGVVALQVHQGPPMIVQFKDLELKELK